MMTHFCAPNIRSLFRLLLAGLALGFGLLIFLPEQVGAVGVSPGLIDAKDLVNGSKIPREFIVTRAPGESGFNMVFTVEAADEGARYLTLPTNTFVMNKGETRHGYTFFFTPKGAPNGEYTARLIVIGESEKSATAPAEGTNVVSVRAGAIVTVKYTITDREIKDFSVVSVRVGDTEVGREVPAVLQIQNKGNVDIRPDKVVLKFHDLTDPSQVYSTEVSAERMPLVRPFEVDEISVGLPLADQKIGSYSSTIEVWHGGKVVFEKADQNFSIFPLGTLDQKAEFGAFQTDTSGLESGGLVLFSGTVKNIGTLSIRPILYIKMELDGKPVDILRSEEKFLIPGEHADYQLTFRPEVKGSYKATAYFEYGVKQTEQKTFSFVYGRQVPWLVIGVIVALIAAGGAFGYWYVRKRRSKGKKQS